MKLKGDAQEENIRMKRVIHDLNTKLSDNMQMIEKYSKGDVKQQQQFKKEVNSYVQQIHNEFTVSESKRIYDKQNLDKLFSKLREDNLKLNSTVNY